MTLGFSTYGMKGIPPEEAVRIVGQIGYDTIELAVRSGWGADPETLDAAPVGNLRSALERWELRPASLMEHLSIEKEAARHRQTLERLHRVAEFAHRLAPGNPPLIQTTLGGGKWEDVKALYLDRLADWLEVGQAAKVVIAIKPHRFGAMNRPEHAVAIISELGDSKWLRMLYDFSHYDLRGMTMEGTVKAAKVFMAAVAVKDVVLKDGKPRFLLPGESGRLDYVKLLRLFRQSGYNGDVCCEVSGMVSGQKGYDPVQAAETCYANVARAFFEAGIRRG